MVGEVAMLSDKSLLAASPVSGKALEPVAFSGKLTSVEQGTFSRKLTTGEGGTFGRKITIGEPAGVRTQGGDEHLTNFASAAVVLPAPRHDCRRMGAAGPNRPAAFPF